MLLSLKPWECTRMFLYGIVAAAMIAYGLFVRRAATGTDFYVIWLIGGVILLAFAACVPLHVWAKLPKIWKVLFLAFVGSMLALFLTVEAFILTGFRGEEKEVSYLIVLGAQVKTDGPSKVLQYRLDKAAEYLKEHPNTVCIVSGGKGPNEPFTEAEGMRRYLVGQGIEESRIILEDASTNTATNFSYSAKLLPSRDVSVGVVTNNFHMFRAMKIAKKQGLTDVCAVVSKSKPSFLPTNMLREFCGVLKDLLFGNM